MSRRTARLYGRGMLLAKWLVLGGLTLLAWVTIGFVIGSALGR